MTETPGRPRRPTRARLQTFFLRHFQRTGCLADAAAATGVTPRTVQRWREANPTFARRYRAVLDGRVELLEDIAMRRACGTDHRPVFHRGRQVATVERHNDLMLMRVLARFDRLRWRATASPGVEAEIERRVAARLAERQKVSPVRRQG